MNDTSNLYKDNLVFYGCTDDSFFAVQKHTQPRCTYFSIYFVDDKPKDLSPSGVETFMQDNESRGFSVAGSMEQIMEEFEGFLHASGITMEDFTLIRPGATKEPLAEQINAAASRTTGQQKTPDSPSLDLRPIR